jgi:DegV family protein with EDD domain
MRTVAGCLGEAIKQAVEWRDTGRTVDQIEAELRSLIPRSRTYFLVATLEYLRRNGRIGGASSMIGSVLQIKPILQLSNGRVEPLDKVRTHQKALERLKELILTECPRTPEARLSVMHADAVETPIGCAPVSSAASIRHPPFRRPGHHHAWRARCGPCLREPIISMLKPD